MKSRVKTYNDGVVRFYKEKEQTNGFAAKINVSGIEDLEEIVKLNYSEQSRRTQDLEFADQNGFSLNLKIKTPYYPGINNKSKAVINNYLYDVKYVDTDRAKKELYAYLEGVKTLDT